MDKLIRKYNYGEEIQGRQEGGVGQDRKRFLSPEDREKPPPNKQFCHDMVPPASGGLSFGADFTRLPLTFPAACCRFVFPLPLQLSAQPVPVLPTRTQTQLSPHYPWKCVCRNAGRVAGLFCRSQFGANVT